MCVLTAFHLTVAPMTRCENSILQSLFFSLLLLLKLGYIEFVMAGVRHSAIVNPAGQLLLTRRVKNS